MVCKNCGEQLRTNEKFCTVCGYYNDFDDNSLEADEVGLLGKKKKKKQKEKKVNSLEEYEDLQFKEEEQAPVFFSHEDHFLSTYIGEDYKWIVQRPFNIYALLLSWMYFLYRKLYLIGILGLVVTATILKYIPIIIVPYIVFSMVGSGLFFNKIYLALSEKKVHNIQTSSEGLDNYTIEEKCRKKGGVNVIVPLFIFLIFLAVTFFWILDFQYNDEKPNFWRENNENQANCKSMVKQAYTISKNYKIEGELEEAICEIEEGDFKKYNIYLKVDNKAQYQYLYFKNESEGYFTLKGNTTIIKELEATQKDFGLSEADKDFLTTSKDLSNKFSSLKDDSNYEDKLIAQNKDSQEKAHYVFTKDDILN